MQDSSSTWWRWPCWSAHAVVCVVGAAVLVRRLLVPWTFWLGPRALCWCRHALACVLKDAGAERRRAPPACRCCGGVDFAGMAGSWAVITGCTDGIGKEFAMQFADRGLHVALVSRNVDKLQAVAQQIHERHAGRVKTKIVVADLTSSGGAVPLSGTFDAVRRGLAGLDVRLLVNNAGVAYARPERLLDLAPCCTGGTLPDPCRDVVECNALATVAMCRIVMPLMVDGAVDGGGRSDGAAECCTSPGRGGNGRGGVVINVSSASAHIPCPLLSVYAATKAFVEKFSVELAGEYGAAGAPNQIAVRCLIPGFVATKMTRIRPKASGDTVWTYAPAPRSYASQSIRALECHCACGQAGRRAARLDGGGADGPPGWLAVAVSAVFDSPSSPLSAGRTGITTTGYPSHTVMLIALNAVRWVFGDEYLSNAASRMLCGVGHRMACKDAAKTQKQTSSDEFEPQKCT